MIKCRSIVAGGLRQHYLQNEPYQFEALAPIIQKEKNYISRLSSYLLFLPSPQKRQYLDKIFIKSKCERLSSFS